MEAIVCICSEEYLDYYKVLYNSLKPYGYKQILYFIGNNIPQFDETVDITKWSTIYKNQLNRICSLRARVVLDAFNRGYKKVLFLGAKLEFYDSPKEMFDLLETNNAVVTPHILEPLPIDNRMPSNASVSFTGHASTDCVGFSNTEDSRAFLEWQDEIMKNQCITTSQVYLDQSWLNFLPAFVDKVYWLRHPGWNYAYWRINQQPLYKENNKWVVEFKGKEYPLVCFQFSGFNKNNPGIISTHQNRYMAIGETLEFLNNYRDKLNA